MSSSPTPATAVPSSPHNGRDHFEDEREKTPTMSSEPAPTNGNLNGDSGHAQHSDDNPPPPSEHSANENGTQRGEKQIKPNKVYIGGLPEQTRQEDLQACFGKIGMIVSIELKLGYGFVTKVDSEGIRVVRNSTRVMQPKRALPNITKVTSWATRSESNCRMAADERPNTSESPVLASNAANMVIGQGNALTTPCQATENMMTDATKIARSTDIIQPHILGSILGIVTMNSLATPLAAIDTWITTPQPLHNVIIVGHLQHGRLVIHTPRSLLAAHGMMSIGG
ncbi:hypothetical protein FRC12_012413 [Ceratobasidium sp. 428]|nr:hypothetical protein FRC12_012413 [Ceratobasidium sp. 428]